MLHTYQSSRDISQRFITALNSATTLCNLRRFADYIHYTTEIDLIEHGIETGLLARSCNRPAIMVTVSAWEAMLKRLIMLIAIKTQSESQQAATENWLKHNWGTKISIIRVGFNRVSATIPSDIDTNESEIEGWMHLRHDPAHGDSITSKKLHNALYADQPFRGEDNFYAGITVSHSEQCIDLFRTLGRQTIETSLQSVGLQAECDTSPFDKPIPSIAQRRKIGQVPRK